MEVDEICPICKSTNIFLVSGGYLCNGCEARLIKPNNELLAVTDFVSCEPLIKRGHFRPTISDKVLWPQEAVNAYWDSVYKGKPC